MPRISQERELDGLLAALVGLLGPLLIVVMGLFVMGIVFAMLAADLRDEPADPLRVVTGTVARRGANRINVRRFSRQRSMSARGVQFLQDLWSSGMSEKPESDEFEDEEADEPVIEDGDVDLDQVIKDLDLAKRRGQKVGDPAWRRLERLLEDKHTAELTSDFEDYEIGDDGDTPRKPAPQQGCRR